MPRMRRRLAVLPLALPIMLTLVAPALAQVPPVVKIVRPVKVGQCVACHGLDGRSRAAGIPHLAAQDEQYLVSSLLAYRGGQRRHPEMNAIANSLQPRDIQALARWYASQPPARVR